MIWQPVSSSTSDQPGPHTPALTSLGALLTAAGPIGLGAALAVRVGDISPIVTLPAIVFAVAALTLPALYIATAVVGVAPPIDQVVRAVGRGLFALGVAQLGLVLPIAFLAVTSGVAAALGLAQLGVAVAALVGLRRLQSELCADTIWSPLRNILFAIWAVTVLVIGARLLHDTFEVLR